MRATAVAGSFYPLDADELATMVSDCMLRAKKYAKETSAYGGVCPHAGYQYSGTAAAVTYSSIKEMKSAHTIVVIGPNHSGIGSLVSLSLEGWETPLGEIENNKELGKLIQKNAKYLDFDEKAHMMEHSVEVQVPFIQTINPKAKIVPICMMDQSIEASADLGKALFKAISEYDKGVIVIASSDFSHYLPPEIAKKNDMDAVSFITGLDPEGFQHRAIEHGWSICGHGPIASVLDYVKRMKCAHGEMLYYTNSGEYGGETDSVVGYASVVFPRKK